MTTEMRRPARIETVIPWPVELPERLPEEIGDDSILWVGRPRINPTAKLWGPIAGLIVLLLPFLFLMNLTNDFGVRDAVFGVLAVSTLLPIALIIQRGLALWRLKNTFYVVTDQQVIIAVDKKDRLRVVSYEAKHFERLVRRERKDGTGNLLFEGDWPSDFSENRELENGFFEIEKVAEVERLIREKLLSRK
jgi:hypothetical protein